MSQEAKSQETPIKKMNQISAIYIKEGKSSQEALADREIWNNVKQQFDKIETTMSDVTRRKEKLTKIERLYNESIAKKHMQLNEFEKLIDKLDKNLCVKDEFSQKSVVDGNNIINQLKDDNNQFTKTELLMGRFRDFKVKIPNRIKDLLQAKKDITKIEQESISQINQENNRNKSNTATTAENHTDDEDDMLDID